MAEVDLYGGDAQRLRNQYRTSLGRDASDDEVGGWLGGSYGGGGMDDWVRQISESDEARQRQQPRTVGPQPGESGPQTPDGGTSQPPSNPRWRDLPTSGPFAPSSGPLAPLDPSASPPPSPAYQDINWWNQRGTGSADIFDPATGQVRPGWTRTGQGYERTGAGGSGAGAPGGPQGGNFQSWFQSLTNGKRVSPRTLKELEPTLAQYGIKLGPLNARGFTDGIVLPNGQFVDVIMSAVEDGGSGWGWIVPDGSGGAGGSGAPGGWGGAGRPNTFNDQWTAQLESMLQSRIGALGPVNDPNRAMYEQALKDRATKLGAAEKPYTQLLDYLQKRFTDLQGPGYTGAENEVIRTGALDPIEADRSAAKKRVMERLSARGLTPDSGIFQAALLEVDKAFDGMRGTTQTALTTNDLNRREDRQQRATSIGAQLVDIPEARSREQLDVFSALELLSQTARGEDDARSREAIGYSGALADLAPQRMKLAMSAAGMGGSPESMMDSLLRVAGLNQNSAFLQNQNSTNRWAGLGSILAMLSNMGRR